MVGPPERGAPSVTAEAARGGRKKHNKIAKPLAWVEDESASTAEGSSPSLSPAAGPAPVRLLEWLKPLFSPQVHVLLSPGEATAPAPVLLGRVVPCVMGLHRSGTKALAAYMRRFFDGPVQPELGRNHGTVRLAEDYKIWKHTVPLGPVAMPGRTIDGSRPVVLLTVRDLASWVHSLTKGAYEIQRLEGGRRCGRRPWWMLRDVVLRTEGQCDKFPESQFPSVVDLWARYMRGYLEGALEGPDCLTREPRPAYLIVRYEDVLARPEAVVEELARIGFPRNNVPFEPIEESASGGPRRAQLLARPASPPAQDEWFSRKFEEVNDLFQYFGY